MTTQVDVWASGMQHSRATAISRSRLAPERLPQRLFASATELRIVQRDFFANGHESDLHGRKRPERVDRNGSIFDAARRQAFDFLESRHFESFFQTVDRSALGTLRSHKFVPPKLLTVRRGTVFNAKGWSPEAILDCRALHPD
jgi:hypothetical protein